MDERLKKQLDFILEADKVKNIMRQTYLAGWKTQGKRCRTFLASGTYGSTFERICTRES